MLRFLSEIRRDQRGNALLIMAAALVPVTMLIGSAVDVSRAYMAKSKLQSACDSAALAARRVMQNDTLSEKVIETGTDYLQFNFPNETYGTAEFLPEFTRPEPGVVRIEAETTIPTVLMQIFGFESLAVNASCEASLNFVNTDVMLVLDVTKSMKDKVGGTPKIEALREAVLALYDELEPVQTQLQSQGLRLRYGIVPYSSTVNVGRLIVEENPSYIHNSISVPSRVANFNTSLASTYEANSPTTTDGWEDSSRSLSKSSCQSWVKSGNSNGGGPRPKATTEMEYDGNSGNRSYSESTNWGWSNASDQSGSERSCRRWRTVTTTTYTTIPGDKVFTNWTYRQETYDTSNFKQTSGTIRLANNANGRIPHDSTTTSLNAQDLALVGSGVSASTVRWNGCIEERDTDDTINGGTSLTIPAAAHDLNINLIPNSDETRWRTQLPEVVYTRTAGDKPTTSNANSTSTTGWIKNYTSDQGYWACPTEAHRLAEWDRDQLETYTNSLQPIGGTYHDIGMIWGARMISTSGIFGDGCDFYNQMPCNRHIIFMTDDEQTAYCNVLTAWGVEQNDLRVTGKGSCPNQLARHEQRFRMVCNAAKSMNASVWVISFGTSLNSNLTSCASNSSQASSASDSDDLIARFRQIGNQIGALRLTR